MFPKIGLPSKGVIEVIRVKGFPELGAPFSGPV